MQILDDWATGRPWGAACLAVSSAAAAARAAAPPLASFRGATLRALSARGEAAAAAADAQMDAPMREAVHALEMALRGSSKFGFNVLGVRVTPRVWGGVASASFTLAGVLLSSFGSGI